MYDQASAIGVWNRDSRTLIYRSKAIPLDRARKLYERILAYFENKHPGKNIGVYFDLTVEFKVRPRLVNADTGEVLKTGSVMDGDKTEAWAQRYKCKFPKINLALNNEFL